jgi:hypothetical protein
MRMILHGGAGDIIDFGKTAIVLLVQGPHEAALDGFEAIAQIRNGAIANDVGGVVEEAAVDTAVQGQLDFAWDERAGRFDRNGLGFDVAFGVWTVGGGGIGTIAVGGRWSGRAAVNGQFGLVGWFLARHFYFYLRGKNSMWLAISSGVNALAISSISFTHWPTVTRN